jgi:hypothetical protein
VVAEAAEVEAEAVAVGALEAAVAVAQKAADGEAASG